MMKSVTFSTPRLVRVVFLLILHALVRGGRWCKLRRTIFSAVDMLCVWGDAACVVACWHAADLSSQEDRWLATGAHDALTHAPVLLAVVWIERKCAKQAAAVMFAAVLQRATLAMLYGGSYYALTLIALRFVWLALARAFGTKRSHRPTVHVV